MSSAWYVIIYVTGFAKALTNHNFVCDEATYYNNFFTFNDRKVFSQNFKAVAQLQAELRV